MQDGRPSDAPPRPTAAQEAPVSEPTSMGSALSLLKQLVVFAGVGGLFNLVYIGLYVALRTGLGAQTANALALVASTIAGTAGHRRITFKVRGTTHAVQHQALGLTMLGVGLVVTAGSLWLLHAAVEEPTRWAEVAVLAAANLGAGLVRFFAFRATMVPERRGR